MGSKTTKLLLLDSLLQEKQWPRTRTWASPETMLLRAESTGSARAVCTTRRIYKFTKKVNKKTAPKKAAVFVEKQVGGAKNGGTRMVRAKELANDVPTVDAAAPGTSKNF